MTADRPVPRADVLQTDDPLLLAARIVILAPKGLVFDVLRQPARHPDFDGSGSVRGSIVGPERLALGDRFGMAMRIKIPYRITSTVVEFEQDRRIAWAHLVGNRWRYVLEPSGTGSTLVTEEYDLRTANALRHLSPISRNPRAVSTWMAKSLVRLKGLCESEFSASAGPRVPDR